MKKISALALAMLIAIPAFAHTASVSWVNSPDTANTNVYRLVGTCPTSLTGFTKLTTTPVTTASYTDSTVTVGTTYAYYVTAILNGTESVPSNCISATVPVAPPTGLSITSVALSTTGGVETAVAKWSDTSGTQQSFFFTDGNKVIAQGLTSSLTGTFAEQWKGTPTSTVLFTVCNSVGQCATQKAM